MSDVCIDIIGVVPVQMVFAYALSRMLAIRSLPVYWALEVSLVVLLACLRPGMNAEVRLVMSLPLVLVPLFLSEGSLSRRIVIVALAHLVLFSAELPGGALWVALTGAPVASYDEVRAHFDAFAITHAAHLALLIPLLMALKRVFDRFAMAARFIHVYPVRSREHHDPSAAWLYRAVFALLRCRSAAVARLPCCRPVLVPFIRPVRPEAER